MSMVRRLPVYVMLDCSGSMSGEPIEGVRNGVELLQNALLSNPAAMDTVHLSVITFATEAKITPLISLFDFQPPQIQANGLTAMGAALNLLADDVEQNVRRKQSNEERGDYRPLVFLFTDGHPTDDEPENDVFSAAVKRVKAMKWGQFVACAGGRNVDMNKLWEVADTVLEMKDLSKDALEQYFKWVSDSIASSVSPDAQQPPLPRGVNLRKPPRTVTT